MGTGCSSRAGPLGGATTTTWVGRRGGQRDGLHLTRSPQQANERPTTDKSRPGWKTRRMRKQLGIKRRLAKSNQVLGAARRWLTDSILRLSCNDPLTLKPNGLCLLFKSQLPVSSTTLTPSHHAACPPNQETGTSRAKSLSPSYHSGEHIRFEGVSHPASCDQHLPIGQSSEILPLTDC